MNDKSSNIEALDLKDSVAEKRKYNVLNVQDARKVTRTWLESIDLSQAISLGLPEIDDRYHFWRVPLLSQDTHERVGEVVIDAYTSLLLREKSTSPDVLETRLLKRKTKKKKQSPKKKTYRPSNLRNTIACGAAEQILQDFPAESVDLIFTSPLTSMPARNTRITFPTKNIC